MKGIEMVASQRAASTKLPVVTATGLFVAHEFVTRPWLKPDATVAKPFSNPELWAVVKDLLGTDTQFSLWLQTTISTRPAR